MHLDTHIYIALIWVQFYIFSSVSFIEKKKKKVFFNLKFLKQ